MQYTEEENRMQPTMGNTKRVYSFMKKITVALLVASVLQLCGLLLPGWIVAVSSQKSYHIGILFMIVCGYEISSCLSSPSVLLSPTELFPMIATGELLVETLLGLIVCCLAAVILQCSVRMCHNERAGLVVCSVLSVLSAVLSLCAAGKTADLTIMTSNDPAIRGVDTYRVPYALISTGIGGLVSGACFMVILFKLVKDLKQYPICALEKKASDKWFFTIMLRTLIMSGFALLAGIVSPGWIVYERDHVVYQVGLFFVSVCSNHGCSASIGLHSPDGFDIPPHYFVGNILRRELRGYAISGFFFYVITCVFFRVSIKQVKEGNKAGLIVIFILSLLSALMSLVAVGKTNIYTTEVFATKFSNPVIYRMPYSLFLSGLGGTLVGIFSMAVLLKLVILFRLKA